MKKLISFPDIEQFRNVAKGIRLRAQYTGKDEQGDPVYDETLPLPTVRFTGTVKLHGSNAGVAYNEQDGLWAQSREQILSVGNDNAGFARYVEENKDIFTSVLKMQAKFNKIDLNEFTIVVFGEWAGQGIQKGTAISNLPKAFYVFGLKVAKPEDESFESYWLDCSNFRFHSANIFNVCDYGTYVIDIDFSNPNKAVEVLKKITADVETQCPVAKAFDSDGAGEGVVWIGEFLGKDFRFKVKGEKHKISSTKEKVQIDPEKLESIQKFIDYAVTENRFNQALEKVVGIGKEPDIKQMGEVIKWMVNDINKEETDVLVENGLDAKEAGAYIATKTRQMFQDALKEF